MRATNFFWVAVTTIGRHLLLTCRRRRRAPSPGLPARWTAAQRAEWDESIRARWAALRALADGDPDMPGVYVVSCWGCSPVYCTTLEAALEWAEQLAHVDGGPLSPFIDSEIHQDGRLVRFV
jgi:hypothetical protein